MLVTGRMNGLDHIIKACAHTDTHGWDVKRAGHRANHADRPPKLLIIVLWRPDIAIRQLHLDWIVVHNRA